MARQDPNPPPWDDSMSDGCSGVLDWLPFVGDMEDCCIAHDKAFHYGGGEKEFREANERFKRCIENKKRCWLCARVSWLVARLRKFGVDRCGRKHFNWATDPNKNGMS